MSIKRQHARTDSSNLAASSTPPPPPRQPLPVDLLLEIAARAEVVTVLHCSATSKPLRRDILDPAFARRHLTVPHAAAHGGFDPSLLLGFSYWLDAGYTSSGVASAHVVEIPPSPRPRVGIHPSTTSHLASLEPLAARDGLLVLRHASSRDMLGAVLCVFDTLIGEVTCLPPVGVRVFYPPALLAVGGDRSFELLVADGGLRCQTFSFSPTNGQWWSPVRSVGGPPGLKPPRGHAVVLGRTVHWLCVRRSLLPMPFLVNRYVLAVDVDAALPVDLRDSSGLLLAAVGGRLSLLAVDERLEVSVWTLTATTPAAAWSRDLVIRTLEMERQAGRLHSPLRMQGFGERSGAVVLKTSDGKLIRLDLGTKRGDHAARGGDKSVQHVCLHEIDLASLLQEEKEPLNMKAWSSQLNELERAMTA
ncbi:hypothetical protein C2845_PM01G26390 [Panicum miliaceum]|uniref:DUF7595 domain-containing protein n=1 Tax=Panicum miliaceum TaxID=4540 RepID=A0A3L6TN11_PANMI|nr:hypothetical protein C2845_PM01G26390 [Panicum miliaceum]